LTKQEQGIVRLVAEGLTNRDIARQMSLSENTVRNYVFRIFEKLGTSNRVELALYAVRQQM
jgi:DNA-binding NarL/FixJ family response regulator